MLNGIYNSEIFMILILNLIIISSVLSLVSKNPIYSLFLLILNYLLVGLIFVVNGFIFLSLLFLLVYIGAVSILLLFTLMLLNIKFIYYQSIKKNVVTFLFYFIFIVELISLFFFVNNDKILFTENTYFFNWFSIVLAKNDLYVVSNEIYLKHSFLIFFCSFLILMSLIASVNIVNSFKSSKKQEAFYQLKNYNKNFIF